MVSAVDIGTAVILHLPTEAEYVLDLTYSKSTARPLSVQVRNNLCSFTPKLLSNDAV
ncbi:unnamed protein product [Soboliphyme baturini]|uniref:Uncharacterized protein n=1 Tax=Soboliphyme baturini TaxID=241478 RepID=A0A183IP62_9BILA|nr:unnamed protein product [Soboliphyme baturini]